MESMETNNPAQKMEEVNSNAVEHSSGKMPRMAGFWDRLLAWLIDYILLTVVSFTITAIFSPLYFYNITQAFNPDVNMAATTSMMNGTQMFMGLISLIVFFGYFGYFYTTRGQTLGKMALKLKVVRSADLKYVGWGEVILREAIRAFLSGLVFYLGYLWYFMSPKRQTWHDMVASTYVVKTDDNGEIFMDGPESYKKEPVKTFGCCGGMALVFIAIIAMVVFAIISVAQGVSKDWNKDPSIPGGGQLQYNNSGMMKQDTDLTEEEMRKMLEDAFREGINSDDSTETAPNAL